MGAGMNEMVLMLTQLGMQQEERRFQLRNNRELKITSTKARQKKEYTVSLLALEKKGQHVFRVGWKWLLLAIASVVCMVVFLEAQKHLQLNIEAYVVHVMIVFSLLAMLFLLRLIKSISNNYIYYSQYSHIPLVEVMVGKPNKEEFQSFITRLENRIKELNEFMELSLDKQAAGELKTVRRLTEEGVLDSKYYESAKKRLLRLIDQNYKNK